MRADGRADFLPGLTEARTGQDRTGLYGDEALLAIGVPAPDAQTRNER